LEALMGWEHWSVIGTWVGAVGQTVTALAIFLYTRSSSRATSAKYLIDMLNEWNRMVIDKPEHMDVLAELRPPVIGHPKDSIVFAYLNCLRAQFVMREERLISKETEQKAIRNGLMWLYALGREKIEQYLSRGYDNAFKRRILDEYDEMSR
jgi:hypothetical protein